MSNDSVAPVRSRAPTRIDFGGGWTDVPPYSEERGGCVCSVAIDRYVTACVGSTSGGAGGDRFAEAAIRQRNLRGVRLDLQADFPVGAGLGGSSAAGVAALGALSAFQGLPVALAELAEQSRALEVEEMGIAGGRQDHYAAAYGGALGLHFGGSVQVARLPLTLGLRTEIEQRCVVVYTGQSRISGDTITAVLDAFRARDPRVTAALDRLAALATEMIPALRDGDLDALGALVSEHWEHQRALHPKITTERIDTIVARARESGAIGVKALGASGGGCVLAVTAAGEGDRVRAALAPLGTLLPFRVDTEGFRLLNGTDA